VRPHDIEIERVSALSPGDGETDTGLRLAAQVSHVLAIGPVVRLELIRDGGTDSEQKELIEVEITKERYRELKLVRGDRVLIKPSRVDLFPRQIH
jgi:sulfate/thiosulfate transport system ATP-binding protein